MANTPETSPLLKADGATIAFSANSDGSLRVRYGGWDEAKVLRAGESLELVVRSGQVWAFRRGEPLKGPAPDPYKDWDGGADLPSGTSPYKKMAAGTSLADFKIVEGSPLEPIGGQNDRGAKGV